MLVFRGSPKSSRKSIRHIDEMREEEAAALQNMFPSLPLAIKWLRDRVQQNQSVRLQVLVTGSLHLVGDVLKLVKK
ncbi:hypothetical protein K1719_043956 [Acacia pycnantha]|nr:hypothetical protein K1719_043956 [Acacia pycnantha]